MHMPVQKLYFLAMVVTRDVKSYSLVMGVPAKHHGWISRSGSKLSFSKTTNVAKCDRTNEKYKLIKNKCILIK